jgi:hypothetical protein
MERRNDEVDCVLAVDFDGRASGLGTIRSSREVVPARAADNVRSHSKREIFAVIRGSMGQQSRCGRAISRRV